MEDAAAGAFGFALFEALRIYRGHAVGEPPLPSDKFHRWVHLFVLIIILVFSAALAWKWGQGDWLRSIYLGLSVPAALAAMVGRQVSQFKSGPGVRVDDLKTGTFSKEGVLWHLIRDSLSIR